jgi:hypothetical protein
MIKKWRIKEEALPLEMWAGHLDHHFQFAAAQVAMQEPQTIA